jgi:arylsulfatase A-like enzyme
VLVLHCDQLRYDSLGCNGNPHARTPNIDALARRGRRFTCHYVANPICQPSRASLLTGLYPNGHGVWTNGTALSRREHSPGPLDWLQGPEDWSGMTAQPPTIGDVFAAAGYRTACFGKLHLEPTLGSTGPEFYECLPTWASGKLDDWTGPFYGFEHAEFCIGHFEKQQAQGGHYANWLERKDPDLRHTILDDPPDGPDQVWISPLPHELHPSSWLAETFNAYAAERARGGEPFCAFVGFPDPHHPFAPSYDVIEQFEDWEDDGPGDPEGLHIQQSAAMGEFMDQTSPPTCDYRDRPNEFYRTIRRHTAAMVWQIDDAIGRICGQLERLGILDNTLIVLTSDHGDYLGNHGLAMKEIAPSRDLIHVPFLLSGPGVAPAGRDDDPMSNVDVLPTLADLAGIAVTEGIHGVSRARPGSGRGHAAMTMCYNGIIFRYDRRLDSYTIVAEGFRYSWYPRLGKAELFHPADDPLETCNLIDRGEHRELLARLHTRLLEGAIQADTPIYPRYFIF